MNSKKSSISLLETVEVILNTINHILIGSVSIYMTWLCVTVNYRLFNLHVLFCTLGYQLLMTEAILALYSGNAWTRLLLRRQKSLVHLLLQIIGAGFALGGMGIEIYLKGRVTWKSNHAIFGLLSGIFLLLNLVVGLLTFWSVKLKQWIKPLYVKLCHNLIGLICFLFGMISLYYGYKKKFIQQNAPEGVPIFLQVTCLATTILVFLGALKAVSYNFKDALKGFMRNDSSHNGSEAK